MCDNEIEKALIKCAVCPEEIGVKFSDIGSLREIKEILIVNTSLK